MAPSASLPEFDRLGDASVNRPAGCTVVMRPHGDGVVLLLPPAGLWRGGGCFLVLSLMWLGGALGCVLAARGAAEGEGNQWAAFVTCLAAGLGMLVWAISRGRRRATLTVAAETLSIRNAGLLFAKEQTWRRADLADVRAGACGVEVNDEPMLELQIHPRKGPPAGLLAWRDAAELRWLAAVLRQALRLPEGQARNSSGEP